MSSIKDLMLFKVTNDPLEAEAIIEILQKHNIRFERSFEKSGDLDDYIGSHPFDTKIVISIAKDDFLTAEAALKADSD